MKIIQLSTLMISIILFIALFFSCNYSNGKKTLNTEIGISSNTLQAKIDLTVDTVAQIDSSIIHVDTTTILGQNYTAIYRDDDYFFVINAKSDTVFRNKELCPFFEFEDFDKDGYKDIRFHYMSNTPSIQDLVLFDKRTKKFKKVIDFNNYPTPEKIIGTKYYYSYHRSGCADMNWDSDLFFIDNFQTFRIGNIAGRECNNRDEKDGIYINKVKKGKEILYKTLPIKTIEKYKDYKWGFIKEYWKENYTIFER
jgi:hypothetical protein